MHSSEGVMWTCVTCFVSRLGEGALRKAGAELARFLINSTMGVAGFLDPATVAGIPEYDEDVGKMLACWGVPPNTSHEKWTTSSSITYEIDEVIRIASGVPT
jgi:hypothetical protein